MKILVVEDEKDLSNVIRKILEMNNYIVDVAYDGLEAKDLVDCNEYDLFLFDIMIPELDGLTLLKILRRSGNNTPTVFLTAKSQVEDKIDGLNFGADDYLTKPFNSEELLARLRAILRRPDNYALNEIEFGDMKLLYETYSIQCNSINAPLHGKEFLLIEYLSQNLW